MKQTGIIFSTAMVRAQVAGIKSMTRRLRGLEEINEEPEVWEYSHWLKINEQWHACFEAKSKFKKYVKYPFGYIGDLLYVRETFSLKAKKVIFKADEKEEPLISAHADISLVKKTKSNPVKWKSPLFLKKKDSRIWLRITDIKVERLHTISTNHILQEGVRILAVPGNRLLFPACENGPIDFLPGNEKPWSQKELLFAWFASLWCELHGRKSWDLNPWVWAISYKPANIKIRTVKFKIK